MSEQISNYATEFEAASINGALVIYPKIQELPPPCITVPVSQRPCHECAVQPECSLNKRRT